MISVPRYLVPASLETDPMKSITAQKNIAQKESDR